MYNPLEKCVDDSDPWMEILEVAASTVRSTYHQTKGKSTDQLVSGQYMILPIIHVVDLRYIHQRKQAQIYKDVIRKSSTIIDYNYRVGYQVMIRKHAVLKY